MPKEVIIIPSGVDMQVRTTHLTILPEVGLADQFGPDISVLLVPFVFFFHGYLFVISLACPCFVFITDQQGTCP